MCYQGWRKVYKAGQKCADDLISLNFSRLVFQIARDYAFILARVVCRRMGIWMRLAALLFLGIVCVGASSIGAQADTTVLRLTMQQSADDPIGKIILQFKEEVERETKGTVTIEVHDKGQLYPDYQVPEVIGGGAVEIGVTQLANYAQHAAVAGVFMQPFLFNFDAIVRAATKPGGEIRAMIDGAITGETGAHVLWWQPHGWNVIFSKGPVTSPKAIANRNVRVFDEVAAEFVKLCGGTPQVISESKQVEALELNIVDSTMTSASSLMPYQLYRKTDTISDIRHSANILVILINDDVWQKLTVDQRSILGGAAKNSEARGWWGFGAREAGIYADAMANDMTIARPAPHDLVEWRACSSEILEAFLARSGRSGAQLLSAYGKLRADPCCGVDPAAAQAGNLGPPLPKPQDSPGTSVAK